MRIMSWLLASAIIAAGFPSLARAGEARPVLRIFTWSDYFDPDVVREFEEASRCRVAIDYFDSNEAMYAKLKAGGGGYDLITPSSYMSAVMRKQRMLLDLDHRLLPNLKHIDGSFASLTEDPEMAYSVPYTRTVTGVGYNSDRVPEEALGSWDIFANPAFAKRMTMLNDMRETLGAALKRLGFSLNSVEPGEIAAAAKLVGEWKRNLAKFDVDEAKMGLASGEFFIAHAYNGDVALIMDENPSIGFFIPSEGTSMASDDFVILAGSAVPELAHAFIDFLLDPETAAANMEGIRYYMPNPAAVEMLSEELRGNPAFSIPDEVIAKCEVIRDLGSNNGKYAAAWDRIKASE